MQYTCTWIALMLLYAVPGSLLSACSLRKYANCTEYYKHALGYQYLHVTWYDENSKKHERAWVLHIVNKK
jgi:hypothetical protein